LEENYSPSERAGVTGIVVVQAVDILILSNDGGNDLVTPVVRALREQRWK